ncbi:tetratricopeptide repeat protein [Polaribacter sp. M15]
MDLLGKLYASQDFDKTIEKANEFLNEDKTNLDYLHILGRAMADKGDFENAIPILNKSAKDDNNNLWRKAWALGYIGTCQFMLGNHEKSETALRECINLNATKNATRYAYKRIYLFGYDSFFDDWDIIESDNFRFYFQKMSESNKKYFVESREKSFNEINKFFKSKLPKKIDFFVWDSREDAKKILKANLGFSNPHSCIIHSHFQQTKGHEMTHVISNFIAKKYNKTEFINEGTAVCFDLSNQNKQKMVKEWISQQGQKVDIKKIWTDFRKYPDALTYPLSGLFVRELIDKYGNDKFLTFFPDQTYENAKNIYGKEIDVFINDFENKMNN